MCAAESASQSKNTLSKLVEQNQQSRSTGATNPENAIDSSPSFPHLLYDPLPSDQENWPDIVSSTLRIDIVKREPFQVVTKFPYNSAKR